MSRRLEKTTKRWLALERADRNRAAERALGRVIRSLPVPAPSQELGIDSGHTALPASPGWVFRSVVTLALTISGLATAIFVPFVVGLLGARGGVDWLVDMGAGLLATLSRRLAAGVTLFDVVARAAATAAEAVATPQALAVLLAMVLFGLATLRLLTGMVAVERSTHHA